MDVKAVTDSYSALQKWVENGEMARTLGTIADVAVKAAMESLESARFADDPKAETGRAITHLQTAHAALETKWEGNASFYTRPFKTTKALWAGAKGTVRADADIKQLRAGIERMELPAAVS